MTPETRTWLEIINLAPDGDLPDIRKWPDGLRHAFELDMAEQGIHHDDWPDVSGDWLMKQLERIGR